jgi:hypothetical protein
VSLRTRRRVHRKDMLHLMVRSRIWLNSSGSTIMVGITTACRCQKDPTDPEWQDDPGVREFLAFMAEHYPQRTSSMSMDTGGSGPGSRAKGKRR